MDIEDIKRWQWIVIGLLVGAGIGFMWSGPDTTVTSDRQASQEEFERDLRRTDPTTKEPLIRKIVVHPTAQDYQQKTVQPVTFDRLLKGVRTGKMYYVQEEFYASVPYKPEIGLNNGRPVNRSGTVADYLADVGKINSAVTFKYAWWNKTPAATSLSAVGGAIIIGGIWPTFLNLMIGAGLGGLSINERAQKKKQADYFSQFSSAPEHATAANPSASLADRQRELNEMNQLLEGRLKAGASGRSDSEAVIEADAPADIRTLDAGPLEAAKTEIPKAEEVELKGEFYPVIIHQKKENEK